VITQFVPVIVIDCTNVHFKIAKNKEYNTVGAMTHRHQCVHVRVCLCVDGGGVAPGIYALRVCQRVCACM